MDAYVREPHEHSAVLLSVDEFHMRVKQAPYMYFVRARLWVSKCMTTCTHSEIHTHTHKRIHICDTQNTFLPTHALSLSLSFSLSHTHIHRHSVCRTPILSGPRSLSLFFQSSTSSHCVTHSHTLNSLKHVIDATHNRRNT